MNIIVGITGASGVIYGINLLKKLAEIEGVITHVVISEWGKKNIDIETEFTLKELYKEANFIYDNNNLGENIASGSFLIDAMVIVPCSMKTLSAISIGFDNNLITRAASVTIKERRNLIICPRETPLTTIHLENMLKLSNMGVSIVPPMPGFYSQPKTLEDIVNHHTMKLLDLLNIANSNAKRWGNN